MASHLHRNEAPVSDHAAALDPIPTAENLLALWLRQEFTHTGLASMGVHYNQARTRATESAAGATRLADIIWAMETAARTWAHREGGARNLTDQQIAEIVNSAVQAREAARNHLPVLEDEEEAMADEPNITNSGPNSREPDSLSQALESVSPQAQRTASWLYSAATDLASASGYLPEQDE